MKSLLIRSATVGYLAVTTVCGAAIGGWSGDKLAPMAGPEPLAALVGRLMLAAVVGGGLGAWMWFRMLNIELKTARA